MIGRLYLDPGDLRSGRYDPPRRCIVLARWGPGGEPGTLVCTWLRPPGNAGPRNVAVRYEDDGAAAVIPFPRRLRKVPAEALFGGTG
jgi:hypothetical protein